MTDFLGPANAPNAVTARPADTRAGFGATDTWFKDCTSPASEDGTDIEAGWLNKVVAVLRSAIRGNGLLVDGVTPVVTEDDTNDNLLLRAVQYLFQRGQPTFADDTGGANVLSITLSPAPPELKRGMRIGLTAVANNTGATTLNVNGLGAKPVLRRDLSALLKGDIVAGQFYEFRYDNANWRLVAAGSSEVPRNVAAPTLYVRTDGDDAHDGSVNDAAHAFASINAALLAAATRFNLSGRTLSIILGIPGTYNGTVNVASIPSVQISGDPANQDAYIISGDGCMFVAGSSVGLTGVRLSNTGLSQQHTSQASYGGNITFSHVSFASPVGFTSGHMTSFAGGGINVQGPLAIAGNCGSPFAGHGGSISVQNGATSITMIGNPSWSDAFVSLNNATLFSIGSGFVSMIGACSGPRFDLKNNSTCNTFGGGINYLPGSSAGTADASSVYA